MQDHLGEVVFVELPEPGTTVSAGASFGNVESVKATSDVNSPISGEVVEVNSKLSETPGLVLLLLHCIALPLARLLDRSIDHLIFYLQLINLSLKIYNANSLHMMMIQINTSPYEDGWMIKVKPSSPGEADALLDAAKYTKHCEEEDAH